jgi:hypothetical protein
MTTIRQQRILRSPLLKKAERDLDRNRGDYILAAIGIVGCVVILVLNLMGVA